MSSLHSISSEQLFRFYKFISMTFVPVNKLTNRCFGTTSMALIRTSIVMKSGCYVYDTSTTIVLKALVENCFA